MADHNDLPKNIADEWDNTVKALHDAVQESRKNLKKRTGTRPFKGEEVTQDQRMIQMSQVDQETWGAIFQKHGIFKEDGRLLLPNEMIKQAKEINKLLKRGEINF